MLGVERSEAPSIRRGAVEAGGFASRHALPLIICLGALLRFVTLGLQDFWLDELVTVELIQKRPVDLLQAVSSGESNPAFYYLVAGAWERVLGAGEFGVRSLLAVVGTATIPLVYLAAKDLAGRRAGLIAAALTATSPMLVWYSQEARNYGMLVFLSALTYLLFAKGLRNQNQRWIWGWALSAALTLCTHYFAIALILPQFVWLLARRAGPKVDVLIPAGAVAVTGIALLPLIATQRGRGDWIDDYGFADRLLQVPAHFLVGFQVPWQILPVVIAAVTGSVVLLGIARADRARRSLIVTPAAIFGLGLALMLVEALVGDDYIISRNLIELWVPFAIAIATAIAILPVRALADLAVAGLCACGIGLVIWTAATPEAQRPDFSTLADEIGTADTRRLIVSQSGFSFPLAHTLDNAAVAGDDDLTATELVVVEPRITESYAVGPCWWLWTCGGTDLSPAPPHFDAPPQFELERSGSTRLFNFSVYEAAEATTIARPVEYLLPRVFIQKPPGEAP